ncbi:MAG: DUF2339 domain-containing protein [Acidobacteriaceae bacterium]|nr:DUF2339 domain-containing protein [Acidobacteriaceae bacterium]
MASFLLFIAAAIVSFVGFVFWLGVRVSRLNGAVEKTNELEYELDRLRDRVSLLERRPAETAPEARRREEHAPPHPPVPERERQPIVPPPVVQPPIVQPPTPVAAPSPRPAPLAYTNVPSFRPQAEAAPPSVSATTEEEVSVASEAKRAVSLEERLGQNWLNKLGIVTLVTGLALFLGYQLRTLGPVGKSLLGLLLSAGILVTGLILERRERYRIFARTAIGGGWALLYFVTFALFHVPAMQVLHSQAVDLVLMLAVATGMIFHSLRYRSQAVTSLAFLLAAFTVAISHVTVFSLVAGAILAAGLVTVAFRERWFVMVLGGLANVYLNNFLWMQHVLPGGARPGHPFAEFVPSAALLLFYWLIFRLFYIFRIPDNDSERTCSNLNVVLNSAGLLALLKYQSVHPEWTFRGLLALGVAELVLAFVARRRHHNAFIILSCIASLCLLAAVPFRFAGSSWSLLWLLESQMLFVAGLALRETVFRRLGVLSTFAASAHLVATGMLPIVRLRNVAPDASHHAVLSLAFGCAALLAWFNAEYATRRWPYLIEEEIDSSTLNALSYTATVCAAVAMWLVLAGPWTLLPWLALALLLAFVSSRLRSADLAQQVDLLSLAAVVRAIIINFTRWAQFASAPRTLILLAATAMLYAHTRRRQISRVLSTETIAPWYSWVSAGMLATLSWYALEPAAVSVAWCLLGVSLLEIGLATRKSFLRPQGFLLLAGSFVHLYFINIGLDPAPRAYTMLPLAAVYAWTYQRLYANEQSTAMDRVSGSVSAWLALSTIATMLYLSLPPVWVAVGGAVLTIAALLLARTLRRPLFSAQAIALLLLTAARTLAFNLFSTESLAATFTGGRVFIVILVCGLLFAGLPIAFSIRRQQQSTADEHELLSLILRRPEQALFFAPIAMLFSLIFVQLHGGMITVGWSALGLLIFLFALMVKERSFRLTGLGLLLLGVGKIITVDIWGASPTERYITLIVMGGALLLVSFLYSRHRETILELL